MEKHPLDKFAFCPVCGKQPFVINNEKSKKCTHCGFIYYFNVAGATVGVIINKNRELLVATRAKEPAKGTLDLPGGFVDLNENIEESLKREIKEETNLEIKSLEYLFSVPNRYNYLDFEYHTIDMVFQSKVENYQTLKAADDVSSLQFIAIENLNENHFGLNSIKEIIKKIKIIFKADNK